MIKDSVSTPTAHLLFKNIRLDIRKWSCNQALMHLVVGPLRSTIEALFSPGLTVVF